MAEVILVTIAILCLLYRALPLTIAILAAASDKAVVSDNAMASVPLCASATILGTINFIDTAARRFEVPFAKISIRRMSARGPARGGHGRHTSFTIPGERVSCALISCALASCALASCALASCALASCIAGHGGVAGHGFISGIGGGVRTALFILIFTR